MAEPSGSDPQTAQTETAPASRIRVLGTNFFLALLFAIFAYQGFLHWQATQRVHALIFAAHEAILVILVITRREAVEVTPSAKDWVIAVVGSAAPLLQRPTDAMPESIAFLGPVALVLQVLGASLTIFAALSLGRSYGVVPANRGIKSKGLYRFVRHPIYGSYFIGYLGFFLGNPSVRNAAMLAATFIFQVWRALLEEKVLLHDPEYQAYASRTRRRFIPFVV